MNDCSASSASRVAVLEIKCAARSRKQAALPSIDVAVWPAAADVPGFALPELDSLPTNALTDDVAMTSVKFKQGAPN